MLAPESKSETQRTAWLCASVVFALLLVFSERIPGPNSGSRLATIDALVHDQTWVIDGSHFSDTIDHVVLHGHKYSSKPPLLSWFGAGVYWLILHATPLSLRDEQQRANTIYLLTLILAGAPFMLMIAYAHKLLRWFSTSPDAHAWALACIALGQLSLAYSTSINNHVPAGAAALMGFYFAVGLARGELRGRRHWIYAGLACGCVPTLDLGALFISASVGLYLLALDWRSTLKRFVPAALVPISLHFAVTWSVTGSVIPIYLRKELYRYPGSYWLAPTGIDALNEPRWLYFWNMTFGHHGFFSMTPVLVLAAYALVRTAWPRATPRALVREAWVIGVSLACMLVFYALLTKNYGGVCVGFRWLLPVTPLCLVFVAVWLSEVHARVARGFFGVCMLIGMYNAYSAIRGPWSTSDWHHWLDPQASFDRSAREPDIDPVDVVSPVFRIDVVADQLEHSAV